MSETRKAFLAGLVLWMIGFSAASYAILRVRDFEVLIAIGISFGATIMGGVALFASVKLESSP